MVRSFSACTFAPSFQADSAASISGMSSSAYAPPSQPQHRGSGMEIKPKPMQLAARAKPEMPPLKRKAEGTIPTPPAAPPTKAEKARIDMIHMQDLETIPGERHRSYTDCFVATVSDECGRKAEAENDEDLCHILNAIPGKYWKIGTDPDGIGVFRQEVPDDPNDLNNQQLFLFYKPKSHESGWYISKKIVWDSKDQRHHAWVKDSVAQVFNLCTSTWMRIYGPVVQDLPPSLWAHVFHFEFVLTLCNHPTLTIAVLWNSLENTSQYFRISQPPPPKISSHGIQETTQGGVIHMDVH